MSTRPRCCLLIQRFYELVIEREFLSVTSEKMKQDLYYYFNYFLNFPRDNMVTTYKCVSPPQSRLAAATG